MQISIPSPVPATTRSNPKKPKTAGPKKPASAITKKNKNTKKTAKTVTAIVEKKRCQHTKKTGAQCGNAVTKGNKKFCSVHGQKKKALKQSKSSALSGEGSGQLCAGTLELERLLKGIAKGNYGL